MEMTKKEFDKWVRILSNNAILDDNCGVIRLSNNRGVVLVNRESGKTAMSKCHPDDIFNLDIGIALAYARLKGYEIPIVKEDIEKEIEDFIFDNIPEPCFSLLYEEGQGVTKYYNSTAARQKIAERIFQNIVVFADGNTDKDYSNPLNLWRYCKKKKDFGDICTLYYRDVAGNYIAFA